MYLINVFIKSFIINRYLIKYILKSSFIRHNLWVINIFFK